jgi:hypothetical protein
VEAANWAIRTDALIAQNVDKGFHYYVSEFEPSPEVPAAVLVEKGWQEEHGWAVFFEQGRHRCILAGTQLGRPEEEAEEDATWEALAAWAKSNHAQDRSMHTRKCCISRKHAHTSLKGMKAHHLTCQT